MRFVSLALLGLLLVVLISIYPSTVAAAKDQKPPAVKIKSPSTGATISAGVVAIQGTASDTGSGIKEVKVRIDGGIFMSATPLKTNDWSTWRQSASMLVLGSHKIEARASDIAGNLKYTSVTLTVVDKNPPQITPPPDVLAEATGPGSSVILGVPFVKDDVDPSPLVTNNAPQSFPVGITSVLWTATDSSGNSASAVQTITVRDTTPPVLSLPQDIFTSDIHVNYLVSAVDLVDGSVPVSCSPPSGFPFEVAETSNVQCVATDSHKNVASDNFEVSINEEGVWFYQSKFSDPLDTGMVDQLIQRHVNTIYFSNVNENFKSFSDFQDSLNFINYAKSKGMKIFAVTMQDPIWVMKSESELRNKFSSTILATSDIFDTYVIDVEPHTICKVYPKYPCFNQDAQTEANYLQRYINMSKILRSVADEHGIRYIDTVPWWYHRDLKNLDVSALGLDSLSGHSINVMDYASTRQQVMDRISEIRVEVTNRYVVNIKISNTDPPWLEGQELTDTIASLKREHLPIGIFESSYIFAIPTTIFP